MKQTKETGTNQQVRAREGEERRTREAGRQTEGHGAVLQSLLLATFVLDSAATAALQMVLTFFTTPGIPNPDLVQSWCVDVVFVLVIYANAFYLYGDTKILCCRHL